MKFSSNVDNEKRNRWLNFGDILDGHLAPGGFLKVQGLEHCHVIEAQSQGALIIKRLLPAILLLLVNL